MTPATPAGHTFYACRLPQSGSITDASHRQRFEQRLVAGFQLSPSWVCRHSHPRRNDSCYQPQCGTVRGDASASHSMKPAPRRYACAGHLGAPGVATPGRDVECARLFRGVVGALEEHALHLGHLVEEALLAEEGRLLAHLREGGGRRLALLPVLADAAGGRALHHVREAIRLRLARADSQGREAAEEGAGRRAPVHGHAH
mmetsp:Transcript_4121/g.11912  ORF Transcript_4121/g.11912 Transcript_4121/m.11912 type:complete len:201 (-) Transcript_4121:130-732(-)